MCSLNGIKTWLMRGDIGAEWADGGMAERTLWDCEEQAVAVKRGLQ